VSGLISVGAKLLCFGTGGAAGAAKRTSAPESTTARPAKRRKTQRRPHQRGAEG